MESGSQKPEDPWRSWRLKGARQASQSVQKRQGPAEALISAFLPPELSEDKLVLFEAARFAVVYCKRSRKQVRLPCSVSSFLKPSLSHHRQKAPLCSPLLTCPPAMHGSVSTAGRHEFKAQRLWGISSPSKALLHPGHLRAAACRHWVTVRLKPRSRSPSAWETQTCSNSGSRRWAGRTGKHAGLCPL